MTLNNSWLQRLFGRRTIQQKWDAQWASERFAWLGRLDELAHYSVLAGYALHLKPAGALLDVGSGDGVLRDRLHPAAFSRYVGIDFAEAIARAQSRVDERTSFVAADMCTFTPDEKFDTIVFNESLYYATDPVAELGRYRSFLVADGVFLVSTHLKPKTEELWASMAARYALIDRVVVTNGAGVQWICGALDPSSNAPA